MYLLFFFLILILIGGFLIVVTIISTNNGIYFHGKRHNNNIALTFDDGPNSPYTEEILKILKENKIKATFFVTGKNVENYHGIIKNISLEGHEIGIHSYSHKLLLFRGKEFQETEIKEQKRKIEGLIKKKVELFRPPYGIFNFATLNIAKENSLKVILWDVFPRDYRNKENAIIKKVMGKTNKGSIIVLHDGGGNREETVKSLSFIIKRLKEKGHNFVTVSELVP